MAVEKVRQIFNMCTRRLDPQVPEKESTDGGAVNATAIEEKAQKGQTAKENVLKNADKDNSMSESERVVAIICFGYYSFKRAFSH